MRGLVFAWALVAGQFGFAEQGDKKAPPKALPDNIVKAWKDAGATVGWMKVDESGVLTFYEEPEAGAIPAFQFANWKDGVVAKLPVPEVSFGLSMAKTKMMDSGLKDLAHLKTLTELCLCETEVTAEAVVAFRKILPKCFVFNC